MYFPGKSGVVPHIKRKLVKCSLIFLCVIATEKAFMFLRKFLSPFCLFFRVDPGGLDQLQPISVPSQSSSPVGLLAQPREDSREGYTKLFVTKNKQKKDKGVGGQRLTDVQADVQGFSPQFWYGTGRCMGDKAPV